MGSRCSIETYCQSDAQFKDVVSLCLNEMQRLENKYSRYRPDSLVSEINRQAGIKALTIDSETALLLHYSQIAFEQSDGLFDITSGVLRRVWDFKTKKVPPLDKIDACLSFVGFDHVEWSQDSIYLTSAGMEIDFGGVVKEYAADCIATILRQNAIKHCLINLAGDIYVVGPAPDNSPWSIGISHPANPDIAIADIPMVSGGLASSGDYQRCFELNGKRYCHILNPKTGWPIEGLAAVSVWAEQCVVAGTLATIAMLKGKQQGIEWLKELGVPFLAIDQKFNVTHHQGV